MKSFFPKSVVFLLSLMLVTSFTSTAQTGIKTKSLKKEFVVGQDVKLNIETSFGKVHCNVWDKNLMTVDVLITVEARSDKDAQHIMDQITPVITGNSSLVDIVTKIGNTGSNGKSKSFSIDYTIYMPRSTTLLVNNRFGDIYIDESTGPVRVNLEYGNLTINNLTNPESVINLKFSNGAINSVGDARINLQYSTLKNKNASDINTNSRFSTLDFGDLVSMIVDSEYDTYSIGDINKITGSGKFSTMDIDKLNHTLDMKVEYGGLEIKSVSQAFSLINLTASFNGIDIGIPSSASYRLNADMSFGECIYPKASVVSVTEKSFTSKTINGMIGSSKNPSSRVNIKGKNCDIKLY